jgi:ABC-2 type transport system permease protein
MRKLWVLSLKEILLTVRDVGALVMMLVTPLAITLVMAAAFGTGGDDAPLDSIPVLLLNQDAGTMGQALVDIFYSDAIGDLVAPELVKDEAAARVRVDDDDVAALVIIPADFSARVSPMGVLAQQIAGVDVTKVTSDTVLTPEQQLKLGMAFLQSQNLANTDPVVVEVYASPDWRISSAVVKSIVSQGLEILNIQIAGTSAIIARLAEAPTQSGASSGNFAQMAGAFQAQSGDGAQTADLPINLHITSSTGRRFSWLGYYASALAVTFLMFAVTSGGRTLLLERRLGTLPRLLITPTPALAILVGKMGGIILTGVLQLCILWGATSLIGAYWGAPPNVLLAILVIVPCTSSVGALISAWAKSPGQASAVGAAITLIGSALGGGFVVRWSLPLWVQYASFAVPTGWGIEILGRLQAGQSLAHVLPWLGGALALTVVYYGIALVGFRRQFD